MNKDEPRSTLAGSREEAEEPAEERMEDWFQDSTTSEFEEGEVAKLAEMEHERWCDERRSMGWTLAPGKKDLVRKTSPYLVPWSKLPDEVKEYDRDAVRRLPEALARAGLQILRAKGRA